DGKLRWIAGKAIVTMKRSRTDRKTPIARTPKALHGDAALDGLIEAASLAVRLPRPIALAQQCSARLSYRATNSSVRETFGSADLPLGDLGYEPGVRRAPESSASASGVLE